MKLNVQLFERSLKTENPLIKDKVKIFSESIIEQIDTLSNIASAFSDFAKMPMSKKEKLDLSKIAENTINFLTQQILCLKNQQNHVTFMLTKVKSSAY